MAASPVAAVFVDPWPGARAAAAERVAVIRADAIVEGDGGKVIVWSDDTTRFYGSLSARAYPRRSS